MRYLILILLLTLTGCLCTGCRVAWTDDLFMASIFTDLITENASLASDPNQLTIKADKTQSETDDIAVEVDPITKTLRLKTD